MESRFQTAGWQSRWVWLGVLAALALLLAAVPFMSGGCEMVWYPDGTLLPLNFPWRPTTPAGVTAAKRLVAIADAIGPAAGWLALSLLNGALWARVVRRCWVLWVLVLTPLLAAAIHLLNRGLLQAYWGRSDVPDWLLVLNWNYLPRAVGFAAGVSLALIVAGSLAMLVQKALAWRMRARAGL